MNKTVTVNISGIIFNIDEEAYARLQQYLDKIRGYFQRSDGRDEIMADIEARIAELFQEKINDRKEVIGMGDVDEVIAAMGQPEDYLDEEELEEQQAKASTKKSTGSNANKRLYRDPDDRVLGGLCSGMGHYLGVDAIVLRILWIVLTLFTSGLLIVLYFILLLVVPTANTTAEKLEMKGEPVNIDNISKKVEKELESLGDKVSDLAKGAKQYTSRDSFKKADNALTTLVRTIGNVLNTLLHAFGKVLGFGFVIGGALALALLMMVLLGPGVSWIPISPDGFDSISVQEFWSVFFGSSEQFWLAIAGVLVLFGTPFLAIIATGLRLLFGAAMHWKGTTIGLFVIWLVGLMICIYVAMDLGGEFSHRATETELVGLPISTADTLYIQLGSDPFSSQSSRHRDGPGGFLLQANDEKLVCGNVELDVVRTEADSFQIEVIRMANGSTQKQANGRARKIDFHYQLQDSVAVFDAHFDIASEHHWRAQQLKINILVPEGKAVYLSPKTVRIISDIKNVTDTWDPKMVGKTWTMTGKGLECIGCNPKDI